MNSEVVSKGDDIPYVRSLVYSIFNGLFFYLCIVGFL